MIILFSTGCPRCKILEKKMEDNNISYTKNDNIEEMLSLGIEEVPVVKLENGQLLNFMTCNLLLNEKGKNAFNEVIL